MKLGHLIERVETGVSVRSHDEAAGPGEKGVLKVSAVSQGRFNPSENKRIRTDDLCRAATHPVAGCTLVSRANTPMLVGEVGFVEESRSDVYLPDKLWQLHPKCGVVDPYWLSLVLSSPLVREPARLNATGTSGSMKNISQAAYLRIEVPVPSLDQQQRVAKTARDLAAVESTVRQLVAHKKLLKARLTDELLMGLRRFPEFTDPSWTDICLGDLLVASSYRGHQVPSTEFASAGRWPIIDQSESRIAGYTDTVQPITAPIPVVVFGDHTRTVKYVDTPFVVGADGVKLLTATSGECSARYLYWLMHVAVERLPNLGYSRHFSMLREIEVPFCGSEHERGRIVAVLDIAEREVETLERLIEGYATLKRGLMERLLSGDLPLPAPSAEPELAHA